MTANKQLQPLSNKPTKQRKKRKTRGQREKCKRTSDSERRPVGRLRLAPRLLSTALPSKVLSMELSAALLFSAAPSAAASLPSWGGWFPEAPAAAWLPAPANFSTACNAQQTMKNVNQLTNKHVERA